MGSEPSRTPGRARRLAPYLPLLLIALGGFAFRVAMIEWVRTPCATVDQATTEGDCYLFGGDTHYVAVQADRLLAGDGFVDATKVVFEVGAPDDPGAAHPPLFTLILALLQAVGLDSVGAWRIAIAAVGSVGVGLLGVAAWRLGGDRDHATGPDSRTLGILAAAIAAANPLLWSRDVDLLVEALLVPTIALMVITSLRLWRDPSFANAVLLGAVIGVAWLTRSEQILLVAFLTPLFVRGLRDRAAGRRIALLATTGAVAVVLMVPWVTYSSLRFGEPVLTTNGGTALLLGACDATFFTPDFGYYSFRCTSAVDTPPTGDEADNDATRREAALTYLRAHPTRAIVVAAARFGRFWRLYEVPDTVEREALLEWHGWMPTWAGVGALYLLAPLAVAGAVQLRRRRLPLSPLLAPILIATLAATLLLPLPRFRTPADAVLVLLAAPGVLAASRWVRARSTLSSTTAEDGAIGRRVRRPTSRSGLGRGGRRDGGRGRIGQLEEAGKEPGGGPVGDVV